MPETPLQQEKDRSSVRSSLCRLRYIDMDTRVVNRVQFGRSTKE